jgi:hypothetical protein
LAHLLRLDLGSTQNNPVTLTKRKDFAMAVVFNPWMNPPETGSLTGEFAGPQLDPELADADESVPEMEDDSADAEEDATESGAGQHMAQALGVIQQQSTLIGQLLAQLKPPTA